MLIHYLLITSRNLIRNVLYMIIVFLGQDILVPDLNIQNSQVESD